MIIVEFFTNLLKGRGIFPSFLVISSWSFTAILIIFLLHHLLFYILGEKYKNKKFINSLKKKDKG